MRTVTITRISTGKSGTFGELVTDSGFKCRTGELPWYNNSKSKSCIPAGEYRCTWRKSSRHGECFGINDVPERTDIEIHSGNFCGDKDEGYKSHVEGCIILGQKIGMLEGQVAVLSSHQALVAFEADMGKQSFVLSIGWSDAVWEKIV